jgi:dTDP-4-amino-4,6-dideoxygalactose transaminase
MRVPLLDLTRQFAGYRDEALAEIGRVFASQRFILGEEGAALERELAAFLGAGHAVGVSSGTDALLVALMALGVGPGDLVVTTPFTFFATAGVVRRVGARPLFADVDERTLTIDPGRVAQLLERRSARGADGRAKVLLPVHLFGRAADLPALHEISARHDLALVEDVAQAFGARSSGQPLGGRGAFGCFSFYPTKNLGGLGDGGLVTTQDPELARKVRALRNHGQGYGGRPYEHQLVGGNFRLDALQCAALATKLPHVARWNAQRLELARRYDAGWRSRGLEGRVRAPDAGPAGAHVYHQYVVRVERREELKEFLAARGIGTAIYYPLPLHLQPCFKDLGGRAGELPVAERAAREVLALPIFPGLAAAEVDRVVDAVAAFFAR